MLGRKGPVVETETFALLILERMIIVASDGNGYWIDNESPVAGTGGKQHVWWRFPPGNSLQTIFSEFCKL